MYQNSFVAGAPPLYDAPLDLLVYWGGDTRGCRV